ncbi:TIR domain-containing protein [Pseudoduganella sp. GCM10020061]|uniref:TIR domain-containing protein n=1 Tax=Pseudoduganella sp. GCM10020061 TaxID=3317345 RepID=UPI00363A6DA5
MSYRNKTYVIFDGDEDIWAYGRMKGWNALETVDFNFFDAHDLNALRDGSAESTVKRKLRERLANAKQAIVLIGENTKNLYRYVRWEIECCIDLGIPIVAVNLNGLRIMDGKLCPPILKNKCVVHVPFKMKIIRLALDDFCANYHQYVAQGITDCFYPAATYSSLGIE